MGAGAAVEHQEKVVSLGKGKYGEVDLYRCAGTLIAVKKYHDSTSKIQIDREVQALTAVKGKGPYFANIVEFKDVGSVRCLVMDAYVAGPLHLHIQRSLTGRLSLDIARVYLAEVVCGLVHIRRCNVIHRDLKASNVLMNSSGHLVLGDFGSAKLLLDSDRTFTLVGSVHCMAPEMVASYAGGEASTSLGYDYSVDWWALGVLLYEMLIGHPPAWPDREASEWPRPEDAATARRAINQSAAGEEIGSEWKLSSFDRERLDAASRVRLVVDSSVVLAESSSDSSFESANGLLSALLCVDPSRRLSNCPPESLLATIQDSPFFKDRTDLAGVSAGKTAPGDADFDRRLGCMELCSEFDASADAVSDADQLLFDGF